MKNYLRLFVEGGELYSQYATSCAEEGVSEYFSPCVARPSMGRMQFRSYDDWYLRLPSRTVELLYELEDDNDPPRADALRLFEVWPWQVLEAVGPRQSRRRGRA